MNDSERRSSLGHFLRKRRASLSPADVGLPAGARRRTAGLRREEVAQLSNIGTSWYVWLEQGRDVRPSTQVLESLSTALRLGPNERRHLFFLAGESLPPSSSPHEESIGPAFQRMLDDLTPNPAYVLGRRWDFVAWNEAASEIFSIAPAAPPYELNLVWRYFTDLVWRARFKDFDQKAAAIIAEFHATAARYAEDQSFVELIEDLKRASPEFDRLWLQHETPSSLERLKGVEHPDMGNLEFDQITLQFPNDPDMKVMIYTPLAATRSKLEHFLVKRPPT